ncbi:MAG: hypothetical protein GWN47_00815 [Woeseiaceae bacterium]|nr:hypothetical protein [Woeseiaceae bacterium]
MPSLPIDQDIANDMVEMLDDTSGVHLEMVSQPHSEAEALDALASGTADIALVSNAMPYRDGVATVIPMYPTVLHVAYRVGRDASSGLSLLQDARIFAGAKDSPSRRIFERIATRLDLSENDFEYVTDVESQADIVILFTPISPERVREFPDLRLFSFGTPSDIGSGSVVDAATLLSPYLRPFVIPAGTYGTITPEPTLTLAVDKYLVARQGLAPSVVYDLIEELLRLRPALAAKHPGMLGHLNGDFDVSRSAFVLHTGTQNYLRRKEPSMYERYSGIAEVSITVLIALISATVAGFRILQRRRKNRIDRFYAKTIALRDLVTPGSTEDERRKAIADIRELQNEAYAQLVDEKLSADESFRIFIQLSDDALQQLGAHGIDRRTSDA